MDKAFFKISRSISNCRIRLSIACWSSEVLVALSPYQLLLAVGCGSSICKSDSLQCQALGYLARRTTSGNHPQYFFLKRNVILAALYASCCCAFLFHLLLLM